MMKLHSPETCLTNTRFDPRLEQGGHINTATFTCPSCNQKIDFTTRSFQTHNGLTRTNLALEIAAAFDTFRPVKTPYEEGFLDFHCPGCQKGVRIIFAQNEFAMSSYYYDVIDVVVQEEA